MTEEAVKARGGPKNAYGLVERAVKDVNRILSQSECRSRIRLVAIAYTTKDKWPPGPGAFKQTLEKLTDNGVRVTNRDGREPGKERSIRQARDDYRADLVSLFVVSEDEAGLAHTMMSRDRSFEAWAFSVVNHRVAAAWGYHSLAHELGHNFGCCHDRAHYLGKSVTDYAFGHCFKVGREDCRTVMCELHKRIPHFSNPDVMHKGTPTGVRPGKKDAAHNGKVIDESAPLVSTFR